MLLSKATYNWGVHKAINLEIKRLLDNKNICKQFFIVDVVDNVD